jgi:hypothetical protein
LEEKIRKVETVLETCAAEEKATLNALLVSYNGQLLLLREDKKELRLIEGAAPAAVWYLSETTIRSLHKFGLRGSVYDLAGMKGAFHSNHQKTSIAYENPQLLAVRVLFSQESQCGSFQSSLEGMVKRSFDKDAEIVHTRVYAPVNKLPNLVAVLSSDYITTDNPDSRDFSVFSRLSSPDDMINLCSGRMQTCRALVAAAKVRSVT